LTKGVAELAKWHLAITRRLAIVRPECSARMAHRCAVNQLAHGRTSALMAHRGMVNSLSNGRGAVPVEGGKAAVLSEATTCAGSLKILPASDRWRNSTKAGKFLLKSHPASTGWLLGRIARTIAELAEGSTGLKTC